MAAFLCWRCLAALAKASLLVAKSFICQAAYPAINQALPTWRPLFRAALFIGRNGLIKFIHAVIQLALEQYDIGIVRIRIHRIDDGQGGFRLAQLAISGGQLLQHLICLFFLSNTLRKAERP